MLEPYGPHSQAVFRLLNAARSLDREEIGSLASAQQADGSECDVADYCRRFPDLLRPILFADHAAFSAIWDKITFVEEMPIVDQMSSWENAREAFRAAIVATVLGELIDAAEADRLTRAWREAGVVATEDAGQASARSFAS